MKNVPLKTLLLLLLLLSVAKLNAQVHIGADAAPKPFSVLELYAKYKTDPVDTYGGLRMPQLDTVQRNALSRTYGADPAFFGLTIYNINNNCLEYWNATKWVSLCLGTADIWLEGDNCTYDPSTPIPTDAELCTYTPVEVPPCVIPNPYQIYLITGFAYANLQIVDDFSSSFTVTFDENNSMFPRIAVVRVVSNCTGEFKDFPFIQPGGTCPGGNNFTVSFNTNPQTLCGSSGAIIAYIPVPEDGMNYIWALNGGVVHTGNYMEIRRSGTYTVYAGLLGCEPSFGPFQININPGGTSPNAPFVTVDNYGMLCPSANVTLTARNVTNPVQWFQNGILYNGVYSDGTAGPPSANPLVVSGASAAGQWFAVQINGNCGSRMSNIVTLIDATSSGSPLPKPIFKVNGTLYNDTPPPVICINGTLELEIVNHAAFPPGTVYEWFANGISIYPPTTYPIIYTNPQTTGTVIISVQASNASGDCPNTSETAALSIIHPAPQMPIINNGATVAYICGSNPANLEVTNTAGVTYEWFRNDINTCLFVTGVEYEKMPGNTSPYAAADPDCYAVRYMDGNGCWSSLSPAIRVMRSAVITLNWEIEPITPGTTGDEISASVVATPRPDRYWWSTSNGNAYIFPPQNTENAVIKYVTAGTVDIRVEAENPCGIVSVVKPITIIDGCTRLTAVTISPAGTIARQTNSITTFTATPSPSGATTPITYTWYKNGLVDPSSTTITYNYQARPTPGVETVYVIASNCTGPVTTATSAVTTINVSDPPPPPCIVDNSGNYRITGPVCYDVNITNWASTNTNNCMPTAGRVDNFDNGAKLTFEYTFSGPTPYTILEWTVTDPNSVLQTTNPITWTGTTATITFRSDIRTWATGRTRTNPMQLTIIAKFCPTNPSTCPPNGATACREVRLVVNVQDCSCGCTVNSTLTQAPYNGKITFMCYNLGVAEPVKTWTVAQQAAYTPTGTMDATVYGGAYQWGRIDDGHGQRFNGGGAANNAVAGPIAYASLDANGQVPSSNATFYGRFISRGITTNRDWRANATAGTPSGNATWLTSWNSGSEAFPVKTPSDPCPAGWRIPTQTEMGSIFRGGTTSGAPGTATSGNTFTWTGTASSGTRGYLITPSGSNVATLFLPAAGYRSTSDPTAQFGSTVGTRGDYTTSTPVNSGTGEHRGLYFTSGTVNPNNNYYRANGTSIRCIAIQ